MGFHIHGSTRAVHDQLAAIAGTGKLAACTVINDGDLANRLHRAGVKYVLHREVDGLENDCFYNVVGDASDIQRGIDWYNARGKRMAAYLDKGVYIQLTNEANCPKDGHFWLGAMQAATQDGRKLAILSDSVGNPADMREVNGKMVSATWQMRVDSGCMRYAAQHGHIVCYHGYGRSVNGKETSDPGSAVWFNSAGQETGRDNAAWKWFGGRILEVYRDIVPADSRPLIVYGEAGPSDAIYRGAGQVINDLHGYQARLADNPYVVGVCFWTAGGRGLGWDYSCLDDGLPTILDWLRTG